MTRPIRNEMLQTCRQFLNFIDPVPKSLFYPSKRTWQKSEKNSPHFLFRFGKQLPWRVHSVRISRPFFLICKSLPRIPYVFCLPYVLNGRMFLVYKYRQKVAWMFAVGVVIKTSCWCWCWCSLRQRNVSTSWNMWSTIKSFNLGSKNVK